MYRPRIKNKLIAFQTRTGSLLFLEYSMGARLRKSKFKQDTAGGAFFVQYSRGSGFRRIFQDDRYGRRILRIIWPRQSGALTRIFRDRGSSWFRITKGSSFGRDLFAISKAAALGGLAMAAAAAAGGGKLAAADGDVAFDAALACFFDSGVSSGRGVASENSALAFATFAQRNCSCVFPAAEWSSMLWRQ